MYVLQPYMLCTINTNKLREIKYSVQPWPKVNHLNGKEEVILNRLRIGHTRVTHGHLMRKTKPPRLRHALPATQSSQSHIFAYIVKYTQNPEKIVESRTTSTKI